MSCLCKKGFKRGRQIMEKKALLEEGVFGRKRVQSCRREASSGENSLRKPLFKNFFPGVWGTEKRFGVHRRIWGRKIFWGKGLPSPGRAFLKEFWGGEIGAPPSLLLEEYNPSWGVQTFEHFWGPIFLNWGLISPGDILAPINTGGNPF